MKLQQVKGFFSRAFAQIMPYVFHFTGIKDVGFSQSSFAAQWNQKDDGLN